MSAEWRLTCCLRTADTGAREPRFGTAGAAREDRLHFGSHHTADASTAPSHAYRAGSGHSTHSAHSTPAHAAAGSNRTSGANAANGGASAANGGASAAPPRIDGKDFFKQARSRLEYEAFAQFLQNIKELNAGKQTREETLERAHEIFGTSNADLYDSFQALLSRHLPAS